MASPKKERKVEKETLPPARTNRTGKGQKNYENSIELKIYHDINPFIDSIIALK